jgi:hypothetical protein
MGPFALSLAFSSWPNAAEAQSASASIGTIRILNVPSYLRDRLFAGWRDLHDSSTGILGLKHYQY